ncbi:MAG: hypothetical protein IJO57_01075 [Bacilli bacterium]|nr:hypothetical protein [Bacilli bacterium]
MMGLFDRLITKSVRTATNTITDTIIKDSLGIKDVEYFQVHIVTFLNTQAV